MAEDIRRETSLTDLLSKDEISNPNMTTGFITCIPFS